VREILKLVKSCCELATTSDLGQKLRRCWTPLITVISPRANHFLYANVLRKRICYNVAGDAATEVSARTADMEVVKILLNSVVSTDSHWMSIDIVDYYLNTPLPRPKYLRVQRRFLPLDIVRRYNLQQYFVDDHVLMAVHKGMYGLPQAGLLAQERLIKHLALSGYHHCPRVPCLFKHDSKGVAFTLVVDDFGIKYTDKESAQHLVHTLSVL